MKALPCKPCCNYCCEPCEWRGQLPQIDDRNTTNYNPISHQYQPVQQISIDQQFQQFHPIQQYHPFLSRQPVQQYSEPYQHCCY